MMLLPLRPLVLELLIKCKGGLACPSKEHDSRHSKGSCRQGTLRSEQLAWAKPRTRLSEEKGYRARAEAFRPLLPPCPSTGMRFSSCVHPLHRA